MKMKPGPKAILWLLMVVALLGAGFWAGRGFPRTWEAVIRPTTVAVVDPPPPVGPSMSTERIDALENRIDTLEQEVATLRGEISASRAAPPADGSGPARAEPQTRSPEQTESSRGPTGDGSVEYR